MSASHCSRNLCSPRQTSVQRQVAPATASSRPVSRISGLAWSAGPIADSIIERMSGMLSQALTTLRPRDCAFICSHCFFICAIAASICLST